MTGADARGELDWLVAADSTLVRVHQHGAAAARIGGTRPPRQGPARVGPTVTGAWSTTGIPPLRCTPLSDGRGRPLVLLLTAGNVNDTILFPGLMGELPVPRPGPGRPRTCPDHVLADKGYNSRENRRLLRRRGISRTIPERADQKANRRRRGCRGGRPTGFDTARYRRRNVLE